MKFFLSIGLLFASYVAQAAPITKVVVVIFENSNYNNVIAQPFFAKLAKEGTSLTQLYAHGSPSQPNYFALTAGDTFGVTTNNNVDLDKTNIADLLEAKGKTWKAYAESYPGNCFTGSSKGDYVRKHAPFISYKNIRTNPKRCANIVPGSEFFKDAAAGTLPTYSFFSPNDKENGHDTGVAYANSWYAKTFGPLLMNPQFTDGLLLITTFDEGSNGTNRIYTTFWGPDVKAATQIVDKLEHYTVLRTVEDLLGLGSLGRKDATAKSLAGILLTP